jgi:hypothetical protein
MQSVAFNPVFCILAIEIICRHLSLPKRLIHMKSKLIGLCILSVVLTGVYSCKKNTPANPAPTPTPTSLVTYGPL